MRMMLVAFTISTALAQTVEFDVASVKPAGDSPSGMRFPISSPAAEFVGFEGGPGSKTPGRIHYTGVTLKMVLVRAYALRPYQITTPEWMETERYDFDAKYPADTTPDDFRLMLQKLLAERFHLKSHQETRTISRYRLVVAKGGAKLSPAQKPPEYQDDEERQAAMRKQSLAMMEAMKRTTHSGPSRSVSHSNGTMAKLADTLSTFVDRPVTDETGLEGPYSYSLEFSPNDSTASNVENPLPSIYTALQDQLGLKLEPDKGPVAFLIIDSAEKKPVVN